MKKVMFLLLSIMASTGFADTKTSLDLSHRYFWEEPAYEGQASEQTSLAFQTEMYFKSSATDDFLVNLFGRVDSADSERDHIDVRELLWRHYGENYQLDAGVGIVYWGVAESQRLVNVINQRDSLEDVLGNVALGQPMIKLEIPLDSSQWEIYLLPYFRERDFAGEEGRLRTPMVVNADHARYESAQEEQHVDYALRYSGNYENIDYGIAYFEGTQRDPTLMYDSMLNELYPFYSQMKQLGMDFQYTGDTWLWKLEALYRDTSNDQYAATVFGFEKSFYGISDSGADIAWLMEYNWDERKKRSPSYFQNDLFSGIRWVLNNTDGTELLVGILYDFDYETHFSRLRLNSRIGADWAVAMEAYLFNNVGNDDPLKAAENDDFIQLSLKYYF
ncbi:MAG: hypothetical protein K0Q67_2987 [Cellvibrio sp.]|nr:hypothetical protein [Cellvibrio sp.]